MGVLYGCKRLDITPLNPDGTVDDNAETVVIDVPQECSCEPQITEGNVAELRGGDGLIAVIEDEDILTGINFTFTNAELAPEEVRAIAGNGQIIFDADSNPVGFKTPTIRQQQQDKTPFKAELYVSLYEQGSQSTSARKGFVRFTLNFCKGTIPTFTATDRDFLTPEFTVKSRENISQAKPALEWELVPNLPT